MILALALQAFFWGLQMAGVVCATILAVTFLCCECKALTIWSHCGMNCLGWYCRGVWMLLA